MAAMPDRNEASPQAAPGLGSRRMKVSLPAPMNHWNGDASRTVSTMEAISAGQDIVRAAVVEGAGCQAAAAGASGCRARHARSACR